MMKDYKELTRLIGRVLAVVFIVLKLTNLSITKINIKAVTGTGHYKLYGKRKWN